MYCPTRASRGKLPVPSSVPHGLSRRSLIAGVAALAGGSLLGSGSAGADLTSIGAVTPADTAIDLHLQVGRKSNVVGSVPPGTAVRVIAGPSVEGWYLVQTGSGAAGNQGWTPGATLTFTQRAQIAWDAGLFTGATDATGWIAALRHGIVVSVEGPAIAGFTWIRYGDLSGFTYTSALVETELPLTDRYGEWWADVNRSTLKVNLMIGGSVVDSFPASMSTETGDGFYSTAIGRYWIYEKVEGLQFTPYANAYFMYWCGFDSSRFNGFHSWTMDANGYLLNGGWGNTAGCVSTEPKHAAIIYAFLSLNSRIEIHW